jgi:hypothetical protein
LVVILIVVAACDYGAGVHRWGPHLSQILVVVLFVVRLVVLTGARARGHTSIAQLPHAARSPSIVMGRGDART